jgi:hypothetical protein
MIGSIQYLPIEFDDGLIKERMIDAMIDATMKKMMMRLLPRGFWFHVGMKLHFEAPAS